nr:hypothetical protein [Tanacetum cinerariifolium]
ALTWWNSHVKIVGHDAAYRMPWKTLKNKMTAKYCPRGEIKKLEIELWNLKNAMENIKNKMTAKYCPRGEIKKLEIELWNLKVKGTDVVNYTQCFQELALMCERMFLEKYDEVEKYAGGLPDMI